MFVMQSNRVELLHEPLRFDLSVLNACSQLTNSSRSKLRVSMSVSDQCLVAPVRYLTHVVHASSTCTLDSR